MPRLAGLILLVWLSSTAALAVEPAVLEAQQSRIDVIRRVAPSVVAVFGAGGGGGGSGVLITPDGYALSNFHVTSSVGDFMKCGLNDGKFYDAVIVGIDPTGDVALLKMLGRDDFPHAEIGDSDAVRVGDWAYVMGNPFLLATDFHPTVTYGIVSGVHRYQYPAGTFLEYADCIQVDSSINPGNSGGPLFSSEGKLIGINGRGSFEKRGRVNVGAGYAISINQISHFLDHLRSGRVVDHATLGATVYSDSQGLVRVGSILESSDAYRRGLREGDEIVSFAGRPIRTVNQFKNILGIFPNGWQLPLVYRQEGVRRETMVRLRNLHSRSELIPLAQGQGAPEFPEPDEEPKPGEPKPDGPGPRPRLPIPHGMDAPQPPSEYAHLLVKKPGFANHYFNTQEQQRVLSGLERLGEFSTVSGRWRWSGTTGTGEKFQLTLADQGVGLEQGTDVFFQALDGSEFLNEPPGSGGLLLALHHLRLFLAEGEGAFTEFYYVGSEPLDGRGETVDVIATLLTGVESRWYFRRADGSFAGFDTQLAEELDPCEVRFEAFDDFGSVTLPSRLAVTVGEKEFVRLVVERAELQPTATARNPKQEAARP